MTTIAEPGRPRGGGAGDGSGKRRGKAVPSCLYCTVRADEASGAGLKGVSGSLARAPLGLLRRKSPPQAAARRACRVAPASPFSTKLRTAPCAPDQLRGRTQRSIPGLSGTEPEGGERGWGGHPARVSAVVSAERPSGIGPVSAKDQRLVA